jgi:ribosomal protein S18 acetylase RimI-like enzyme
LTKPDLKLREFQFPGDYPAVYALWQNAGSGIHVRRSDELTEISKKLQRDPDLFIVAEMDGEIIGTVLGGFDGRRGMMYHLAVSSQYRREGIGEQLMQELERRLREKGCLRYYLLVTKDNQEAIQFYKNRGCEPMNLIAFGKDIA